MPDCHLGRVRTKDAKAFCDDALADFQHIQGLRMEQVLRCSLFVSCWQALLSLLTAPSARAQGLVLVAVEKAVAVVAVPTGTSGSVVRLVDAFASKPASAFASRDFYELLHVRDHTQGISRLCIDDSGSVRISNSHNEERDTSDPCTLQCASTGASFQRNEESRGSGRPRAGTLQRVATEEVAVVDVSGLAVDQTPAFRNPTVTHWAPLLELVFALGVLVPAQEAVGVFDNALEPGLAQVETGLVPEQLAQVLIGPYVGVES